MVNLKGVGQALVVIGVLIGIDSAGGVNAFGAALAIVLMLLGVVSLRISKRES